MIRKKRLKLVFLLQDLEFGGTQRYAINLMRKIDQSRFRPELWLLCNRMDMAPLAQKTNIRIRRLSKSHYVLPDALLRLAALLIREKPDILYTLTVVPNIWGRFLGKLSAVPAIVSSYRNPQPRQYDRLLWPLSRRIICNAVELKRELMVCHGVPSERIAVVANGVDAGFWVPGVRDTLPTVAYLGRLITRKDPVTLITAFALLLEEVPDARLLIIGNGHLKQHLSEMVRRRAVDSQVSFFEGKLDPRPLLQRAWLFAMSPAREASPNTILEAMSMGLPVVTTSVGGIPEIVAEGKTGFTVTPKNPRAMAAAMAVILQDSGKREEMSREARKRVMSNHTLEQMVAETEKVLQDAYDQPLASGWKREKIFR